MKAIAISIILLLTANYVEAGAQQDFFLSTVAKADRVVVVRVDPSREPDIASIPVTLIDSRDPQILRKVTDAIEMEDPQPEERNGDEETWRLSILTFGVADYVIRFFAGDQMILEYGTDKRIEFLAPFGAKAKQSVDLWMDYPLSEESSRRLRAIIRRAEKGPTRRYRQPR